MLTKEKIELYKKRLEDEKIGLLEEMKTDEKMVDFGNDVTDKDEEEADEAEELGNVLGVKKVLKIRINKIDSAIDRIQNGSYGKCAHCGEMISEQVLDAAPESDLCESCKKKI